MKEKMIGSAFLIVCILTVTYAYDALAVAPILQDDAYTVFMDSSNNTLDVLSNDTDEGAFSVQSVSVSAQNATVSVANRGTEITYTPPASYCGSDSFTYTAMDDERLFSTANVDITVDCSAGNPEITEVVAVPALVSDSTPSYTLHANVAGTLSYEGSCNSVTTSVVSGDTTITFDALDDGTYDDCVILLQDEDEVFSEPLSVSSFTVDTLAPVISAVENLTGEVAEEDALYSYSINEDNVVRCTAVITVPINERIANTRVNSDAFQVIFNNLVAGTTYEGELYCDDNASNRSNTLTIGPFTAIDGVVEEEDDNDENTSRGTTFGYRSAVDRNMYEYDALLARATSDAERVAIKERMVEYTNQRQVPSLTTDSLLYKDVKSVLLEDSSDTALDTIADRGHGGSGSALSNTTGGKSTATTGTASRGLRLSYGDISEAVLVLQKYLNAKGFVLASTGYGSPGFETVFFGPLTRGALMRFQEEHDISIDGIFGPQTQSAIQTDVTSLFQ